MGECERARWLKGVDHCLSHESPFPFGVPVCYRALDAALKEAIGQRDRANHAYEVIQEWQAKQSKIYVAAEARAKALEALLVEVRGLADSAGFAAWRLRVEAALARPGEPAGGGKAPSNCGCGDKDDIETEGHYLGCPENPEHRCDCDGCPGPAARRDGRE